MLLLTLHNNDDVNVDDDRMRGLKKDNVLCWQSQRVVFAISTCCVCRFNVLPFFLPLET